MAIEQGIVIKLGPQGPTTAWVKTVRSSACEACASRDSCHSGEGLAQEVEAINTAGASVGDRIQLSVSSGAIFKATFLLYLFPILCMMAGGFIGSWLAPRLEYDPSTAAVIGALVCFGASMLVVRGKGQRMGLQEAYRPKIIRIMGHEPQHPSTTSKDSIICANTDIRE